MFKMLSGTEGVEIHHEYVHTHVQKIAVLYYMRRLTKEQAQQALSSLHASAIHYASDPLWIDSSHKLSWLVEPLIEMFPNARFLNVVRDGRKVVGSFFVKLSDEIYRDDAMEVLDRWLVDPTLPIPPPEKKYWWNIPQSGQPFYKEFANFNRFERICYHWQECNRFVLDTLQVVPADQKMTVKLEELTRDEAALRRVMQFLTIPYSESFFEFLQTPHHVLFPMDVQLTAEQRAQFNEICQPMMQQLGYSQSEAYKVVY